MLIFVFAIFFISTEGSEIIFNGKKLPGITERMKTLQLRKLEEHEIISMTFSNHYACRNIAV
ncbi:winged helix-turn-helix transcriptional regulator [Sphingobacterium faecium]|uniref:winged helix-turn-helix transcriptional regulator n=1 Tax=Sphingobacterium faecium TaxID=34087 RepID=UPI000D3B6A58|nr:winged helix-turn-helix transcriptional regulator [Sphingobacterium faecium]PTX11816.1 HxlR family transcriptional regulator [Sphingobacterium faecium]